MSYETASLSSKVVWLSWMQQVVGNKLSGGPPPTQGTQGMEDTVWFGDQQDDVGMGWTGIAIVPTRITLRASRSPPLTVSTTIRQ